MKMKLLESLEMGVITDMKIQLFLINKNNKIYENRDNLNVDPLIQEYQSIAKKF